ncbi:unnamed protein product [Angiostrongylus costaricensis]|uniref:AP2/ERF domain-containing protein n=1 Tax=Angiostrongylus costaricensis TaxID=334426 RepID=A0A0R3PJT7_ANGCS|nr:unnamed protein product [Angiostrongylus costaricensis]
MLLELILLAVLEMWPRLGRSHVDCGVAIEKVVDLVSLVLDGRQHLGVQLCANKPCVLMATYKEGGDGRKMRKKDALGEAEEKLAALSLEPDRPIMAPSTAAGTFGTPFNVQTNVFGVKLEDTISIWRYDVAVFAEIKGKRAVFFTKKSREEYVSFVFKSISTA